MKKILLTYIMALFVGLVLAQSPNSFNYQAVIRDSNNEVISSQAVGMRIALIQGSSTGNRVYEEIFNPTTNSFGLVNMKIGTGTVITGTFSTIDWSDGLYFIETAFDISGGTSYNVMGTSQLLSVPYALYAETSGSSTPGPVGPKGDTGADGENGNDGLAGADGAAGTNGLDGKTILNGTIAPTTEGVDGDFYINTATNDLYGPKTTGTWGSATSLIGAKGDQGDAGENGIDGINGEAGADGVAGTNGLDGKTILNGTIAPTTEGVDGDFFINTATNDLYGPKTAGVWGTATSLIGAKGDQGDAGENGLDGSDGENGNNGLAGADGAAGTNGLDGKTILNGTIAPTTEGVDGDFYINTATNDLYGPKTAGAWGIATTLIGAKGEQGDAGENGLDGANGENGNDGLAGADGAAGTNGLDGKTILNGTIAPTTEGVDGDFYINTTTSDLYGPKTTGTWGSATSLIGAKGDQGDAGENGLDGNDGENGIAGEDGVAGINGTDGKTILNGTIAPTTEGVDGDFYLNTATNDLYGPKTTGTWGSATSLIGAKGDQGDAGENGLDGNDGENGNDGLAGADGAAGTNGLDGKTILNGTIVPTTEGTEGDFFINTATNDLYGPKTAGAWGNATSLIGAKGDQGDAGENGLDGSDGENGNDGLAGADGAAGANGLDGKTLLNGTIAPTTEGVDGDFYINTATNDLYGPKTTGTWGSATSLIGVAGNNGTDGKTLLSGTIAPTTEGVDGDFYINTTTSDLYGPKTTGAWGSATALIGAAGSNGNNGTDGKMLLSGNIAPTTEGADGDFYINTATSDLYGPKTTGAWGSGTSLIGATGAQGPAGITGGGGLATYRWATFHTYSNALGEWSMQSDPDMHGGVTPANWTDANGLASDMSSDKEVLRTLFQRKGYATRNAMIYNNEWASFSSTNGQVALVLFRIENTTGSPIDWSPNFLYSCYSHWGERASVALNGVSAMNETTSGAQILTLSIPAGRTSTVIFVSTSSQPTGSPGMRLTRLGFRGNSLDLPAGLQFVDDLDTATGGYEQ